jgi:hypothetical protein
MSVTFSATPATPVQMWTGDTKSKQAPGLFKEAKLSECFGIGHLKYIKSHQGTVPTYQYKNMEVSLCKPS